MFGFSDGTPMPPDFLTSHDAWDAFVGSVWARVLVSQGVGTSGQVVELAPGASTKIGAGLAATGFSGRLFVIDASRDVLDVLAPRYRALMPDADIVFMHGLIEDAAPRLPRDIDAVLANHIFDDMILNYGEKAFGHGKSSEWVAAYTHVPSEGVRQGWHDLSADDGLRREAQAHVLSVMTAFLSAVAPRRAIVNQYPSATLQDHGLQSLNDSAYDVLRSMRTKDGGTDALRAALDGVNNYGNRHIGCHLLDAEYWLSCACRNN